MTSCTIAVLLYSIMTHLHNDTTHLYNITHQYHSLWYYQIHIPLCCQCILTSCTYILTSHTPLQCHCAPVVADTCAIAWRYLYRRTRHKALITTTCGNTVWSHLCVRLERRGRCTTWATCGTPKGSRWVAQVTRTLASSPHRWRSVCRKLLSTTCEWQYSTFICFFFSSPWDNRTGWLGVKH